MIKTIYSIVLLIACAALARAQNYPFTHLQVEDGLSHNSVICMLQDRLGFMWFGTKDGLNRYDGYRFKIFQHLAGDPTSIGSNFIRCLYEFNNYLWVGTDTGLFRYDERNESFTIVEVSRNFPILDVAGSGDSLWFIASGTLFKIIGEGKEERVEKYEHFNARLLACGRKGEIYVATANELYQYVPENNSFIAIRIELKSLCDPIFITAINAQVSGKILIGTKSNGAFALDLSDHKARSILSATENPLFVRDFLVKSADELWIATESGLFIYKNQEQTYQNSRKNYADPYSLSDNAVYSLALDKEGGVWVGAYFGGVNYYPKQYTPMTRYFPQMGKNSLSGSAVREIKKDLYGNLWIGTEDAGLNKLDLQTGKFENFTVGKYNGNLSHYNIHGLLPRGRELWVGTFEHGLDIFDIKSGKLIKHYGIGKGSGLRSDFIFYIYQTRNHDIYLLTSSGVHRYLQKSDSFEVVEGFPQALHYTCLNEAREGTLWAGTYWDGLYYFNPKTGEKGFYRHEIESPESLSSNVISSIFEDSKNRLWITTENGLNVLLPKTKKLRRYTKEAGFPANISYAILEDKNQKLWISTSNGLVKFDPETNDLKVYTKSDGLLSDQFNYCSAFQDADGQMYFGSVKGLISFHPSKFEQSTFTAPLYISNIFVNNKEVPIGGGGGGDNALAKIYYFFRRIGFKN